MLVLGVTLARRIAIAAALAALVAWCAWTRWRILSASPFPVGIDGYFYPIQLRALLEHGSLAYPASPLAFWLMYPFALATDPIEGAKLGAAIYTALVALPAFAVGARLGKSAGAGLVAAAIATTSAGSAFLTIEFVKNGIGITVGLTALWLVLRAIERRTVLTVGLAAAGVIAAFLAHKTAAAFVVIVALPAALAEAAGVGALRGRRLIYTVGGLGVFALVALALGIVAPELFLSPDDLGHQLLGDPHFDLPALATPNVTLSMGHEALLAALAAAGALVVIVRRIATAQAPAERFATFAIAGLGLVLAIPWLAVSDPQGLGFRMRILAFVPLSLCAAVIAGTSAKVFLPERWRDLVLGGVALAIVGVVALSGDRTEGKVFAHPAMVAAVQGLNGRIPASDIAIVPERHIAFMVTWYTRTPFRQRPEAVPREHRWRVMPLAFIGMDSPLDQLLTEARKQTNLAPPIGTHPRHPNGLVLVPEATWEWILARLPPAARDHFAAWPTI